MTTGELCEMLQTLPRNLPVLLQLDCDVTVRNAVNDRVCGHLETAFDVALLDLDETFSLGSGWHTAAFLIADREV